MRRFVAIVAVLLGVLVAPLALTGVTMWLGLLGHVLLAVICSALAWSDALAGRPFAARCWGAWFVAVTGGMVAALHGGSWQASGWAWGFVFVALALYAWIPPALAVFAGAWADRRQRTLALRAVRRRRAAAI